MDLLFGIPTNRIVAFCGPILSLVAGGAASVLVAKVNVLGLPGLDEANVATWITAGGTLVLGTAVSWLGHQKWLTGHQIDMVTSALADLPPGAAEQARSIALTTLAQNLPAAVRAEVAAALPTPVPPVPLVPIVAGFTAGPATPGFATTAAPPPPGYVAGTAPSAAPAPTETPADASDAVHAAVDGEPGGVVAPASGSPDA